MNVVDIEENVQELVSKGFKPGTFILDFVKAYDAPKALIQQLKGGHQNLSDVDGAVLWRRNLHYKLAPKGQVAAVIAELERSHATSKFKARFVISTDGDEFSARDLVSGNTINCHFDELVVHFASFLSLAGIFIDEVIEENPIDIKATKRLTKFYDSILQDNLNWKTDEMRHTLNHFITQVIFCLFAEDTGIIADNIFTDTIRTYCESDSEQAQPVITAIFTAMAHPEGAEERSSLPGYARKFPHVNGGLFRGAPQVPRFLRGSVRYLMDAGALDWKEINPDIFGSMIQAIVHQDQRGELGMHYTSVSNILKLLKPLFLNDLQEQVQSNWNSRKGLQSVLQRLMKIRVFDPACGSGNFLVIAYRELRNIEIQVIRRLSEISDFSAGVWSHVELKNFFGIEYIDFAAETAKLSLWIAEYQMNKLYEDEFGKLPPSLPLKDTNNICHGNALRVAWESVCSHSDDPMVETYIVGNPPYLGGKKLNKEQNEDKEILFSKKLSKYGMIDYVACWLLLASKYSEEMPTQFAFVTTSSINQGKQSFDLWPLVLQDRLEITYAYRPFKWTNNAANVAGVHCTICVVKPKNSGKSKYIVDGKSVKKVKFISPQIDIFDKSIKSEKSPISKSLTPIVMGSNAIDGGHLQLSLEEAKILQATSQFSKYVRKYGSFEDVIKGKTRYILTINDNDIDHAKTHPIIDQKINSCRAYRLTAGRDAKKTANKPHALCYFTFREGKALILPQTTTTSRFWLPSSVENDLVISIKGYAVYNFQPSDLSIFSSKIFYTWCKSVCSWLGEALSFSNTSGWNTFPVPELLEDNKAALKKSAEDILLARDHYFEQTISELYDPKNMEKNFPELWEAHQRNDEVVETIYNGKPFESDTERLEHLFTRYVEMTSEPASMQKGAEK